MYSATQYRVKRDRGKKRTLSLATITEQGQTYVISGNEIHQTNIPIMINKHGTIW